MQLKHAVELIAHPISAAQNVWADLGCGDGLFTKALSHLLFNGSLIYAVDKNKRALSKVSVKENINLIKTELDFTQNNLPFNNLSGILMANSFHYVQHKTQFIQTVSKCLTAAGYFLIVEYDTDNSNPWVPYPVSFNSLKDFFTDLNYITKKLSQLPSRYNGMIYSAIVTPNNT